MATNHEFEVELFRRRPELARELLLVCARIKLPPGDAELGSVDLTQAVSAELRADAITVIRDANRTAVWGVIVEVQRHRDSRKKFTWPLYVCALRARLECPVTLLVIAPDDGVATWAREPIEIGPVGFCLHPIAIKHADVPELSEPSTASPELVILSALGHPSPEMLRPLATLMEQASGEARDLYLTLVTRTWSRTLIKQLEAIVTPELAARLQQAQYTSGVRHGREEGREEGLIEGRQEGREEGRETLRGVVLTMAEKRGVLASLDLALLDHLDLAALGSLAAELGTATSDAEARAVLERLRGRVP